MSDHSRVMHLDGVPYPGVYLCGQDAMALAHLFSSPEFKDLVDYNASFGSSAFSDFIALVEFAHRKAA